MIKDAFYFSNLRAPQLPELHRIKILKLASSVVLHFTYLDVNFVKLKESDLPRFPINLLPSLKIFLLGLGKY